MTSKNRLSETTIIASIRNERLQQIELEIEIASRVFLHLDDCSSLDSYSILEFAHSIPKRAHDIIKAMHSGIAEDRVVPVIILARALLETTATGCFFYEKMLKGLVTKDHAKIARDFVKFYAGGRIGSNSIKGFHTNDGLRHLAEIDFTYFSSLTKNIPLASIATGDSAREQFDANAGVMRLYDELSEIAHPNGLGLHFLYPADDGYQPDKIKARYRFLAGASVWQCQHIIRYLKEMEGFDGSFNQIFPDPPGFQQAMKDAGLKPEEG